MLPARPRQTTLVQQSGTLAVVGLATLALAAMTGLASAASRDRKPDEVTQFRPAGAALMAIVSLQEQRVTIYDAEGKIFRAPVSTGQTGYETPAGIYSVIQKEAEHYSNLYDDASMPFMQRITWSGIALHAGALPGYPASHGCIRMPIAFAEQLFGLTKTGMRVIVVPRDVEPTTIAHPALFKPKTIEVALAASLSGLAMQLGASGLSGTDSPKRLQALKVIAVTKAEEAASAAKKAEEARQAATRARAESVRFAKSLRVLEAEKLRAETQLQELERALTTTNSQTEPASAEDMKVKAAERLAKAQLQLDAAKTEGQQKLDTATAAREAANTAEAERVAAVNAAKEAAAKMAPVSVFISRQAQRLYVRQAFQPIFETPITISDDRPVGTHIYTASGYTADGADVRWSVVSMSSSANAGEPAQRHRGAERSMASIATDAEVAKAALDRIVIPQEAIDRIAEVVSPGSTLIVSDEPMSTETGKGTDFVVLMSGEPQGGIKIRQRSKPDRYDSYDRRYQRYPYQGGGSSFWW